MRKLVTAFVKYPFYANLILVVFLVAGGASLVNMKLSFFPELPSRNIFVTVAYPGASPKEMEEGVTMRIEEALRSVVGIKEVTSTSSENFATINIRITYNHDIDDVLIEVKNAVDGIPSLPVDAEKPIVYKQRAATFAGFMGLTGEVDLLTLKMLSDEIENDFLNSGILSQIAITGFPELEISVETNEATLLRYGLTFDDISRAISFNNIDISAGIIRSEDHEVLIRTRNRTVRPNDIGDIVVRASMDGDLIKIRDIADVKLQFAEGPGEAFMNGKPSISFKIDKLPDEDLKAITAYLNDYVVTFNNKHPLAKLEVTYSFYTNLLARLKLLLRNGGIGLVLVILALGLFLNFRLSFWVAIGIPASFLGMFVFGNIYDITINMISLFGMILVIGILVDDGIVIGENIFSKFEKGLSPKKAAIEGTMEVLPAVATSVTTTIIAFSPLFFIEGRMEMMYDVAFVVIFALAISLLEAFFVLPAHLGNKWVLREKRRSGGSRKYRHAIDRGINLFRNKIYGKILKWVISYRAIVIAIPIGLVMITIGLFSGNFIRMTFFPNIPFDQFNIDIAFKPGTGEKITDEYLVRFEKAVWEVNAELMEELDDTVNLVNYSFRSVGAAFNGQETGSHSGNILVLLRDLEDSGTSSFEIVNRVLEKTGPVPEAQKYIVAGRNTFGDPVSVSLLSSNQDDLEGARSYLRGELAKIGELNNITDNYPLGKQEIRIRLKPQAYILGFNYAAISAQIRQGFFGGQSQRLQSGRNELRVWVRYPQTDRYAIGQLERMKVKTPQGEYPLTELIDYDILRGPVNIRHYKGSREITVTAGVKNPDEPTVAINEKINTEIVPKLKEMFPNVIVEELGQKKESKESGKSLGKIYMIAFALMMMLIMIHFKSFSQMLIIMSMIPLAILGSLWGHGIEGIPVSMLSVWGIVALTGVIINDAVVFLARYNSLLLEGLKVKEAVYQAGIARFRAIILTTLTTTVGLYPIILENSFQAKFLIPLAVALAYGVFVGTIFILIFFPAAIMLLNDLKVALKWLWTGRKPEREEVEKVLIHQKRVIE
jgi:multidrug efflux pump subunit AcrB